MSPTRTLATTGIAALLALAACANEPAVTAPTEPPTTVVPEETSAPSTEAPAAAASTSEAPAPVTTEVPTTTEAPASDIVGVVWGSGVSADRVNTEGPVPAWAAGSLNVVADMALIVPNGNDGELQQGCREEQSFFNEMNGTEESDSCLFVQFRFNVGDTPDNAEASVSVSEVVTGEGQQLEVFAYESARPNTVNNALVFLVPGAGPGSRLYLSLDGGGFETFESGIEFVIPGAEFFAPVDFV